MITLCFVCTGNICRSPTAEGIMQALVQAAGLTGQVTVASAGLSGNHVGEAADPRTRRTAEQRGLILRGTAKAVAVGDFERFDYVIALDRGHLSHLRTIARARASKVHLLRDFDPGSRKGSDVPDPYYGGPRGFEEVYDLCDAACRGLLAYLQRTHGL